MRCRGYGCSCPRWLDGPTGKQGWQHCGCCGHTKVRDDDLPVGYCCLGVLCDVAIKAGVQVRVDVDIEHGNAHYDGDWMALPESVKNWAGLKVSSPAVPFGHEDCLESLAELNDEAGLNFDEIADLIEASL